MNIQNNKEDSSLSSDSSWTFINDSKKSSRKTSFEKVSIDIPNGNVTKESLEQNLENEKREADNSDVGDTSFLNFDEYSFERLSECVKTKPKGKKIKKKRKCSIKCYGDPMNFLTITACLLTITGITLLTTFLPPNYAESAELENFQNHLADVYENSNNPTDENAVNSLLATMEAIDSARSMDIFNIVSRNLTEEDVCEVAPDYQNESYSPEDAQEFKIRILTPYVKEIYSDENKSNGAMSIKEKGKNKSKSFIEMTKDLVKSPSLQIFVATLVQDLCLIKLINEFSKATREKQDVETKERDESIKKVLKKIKKISGVTTKKTKKTGNHDKIEKASKKKKSPTNLEPDPSDQLAIKNIGSNYKSQSKEHVNENGKSECERRFEDLDTRGVTLGYNHWQKIQQIKNKFQKQIFQIKEQEKENYNRSEKVRFTREKFLQRLKSDREIYLHRLRKIREERKKLLDDVCHGLNCSSLGSKDVSANNFAVLIPDRIKDLDKTRVENNVKLTAFSNETISYVPLNNNNKAHVEEDKNDFNPTDTNNSTDRYCELKRKYLRKKASVLKKRKAKQVALDVQDVMANIMNQLSESPLQPAGPKVSEETSLQSNMIEGAPAGFGFQIATKKKTRKRNLNKLYQAAFDGQSKKIKEHDAKKWAKTNFDEFNWVPYQELTTKQDPLKTHKAKIIHKGVL